MKKERTDPEIGINTPQTVNPDYHFQSGLGKTLSLNEFYDKILAQDRFFLSKAITFVESKNQQHREFATRLLDRFSTRKVDSIRIAITGVPGVGKSSFIESFGMHLIDQGKRLAVLAIDPSSQKSGGAILGDKTRMEKLACHSHAYIRPSATGDTLGGVAARTREAIVLCEAAGFNVILVETVGVGQSEIAVANMVDFFLLIMLAGAGDELQGIKRGIMEMADMVVVNKADGPNIMPAELASQQYARALQLFPAKESSWVASALTCSALHSIGMEAIWQQICRYRQLVLNNGFFQNNRQRQAIHWFHELLRLYIQQRITDNMDTAQTMQEMAQAVAHGRINPDTAARNILQKIWPKVKS